MTEPLGPADRFTAECLQALRADLLDLAENAQP